MIESDVDDSMDYVKIINNNEIYIVNDDHGGHHGTSQVRHL